MENKHTPDIRFAGFTDAWEQRKYGEVIDLLSGQDFSPSEYNDTCNGIPYMTGASCIVGKETIVNRWTTVPRCLAEKGDVLLVCKGSGYGAIAVMAQDKAHIARQFMALKNLPNLDKVFNFYLLNSVIENIKKDARGLIAGIARDAVIKQEISIPLLAEQSQIGSLLKTLDDIIALHQRKLDKLKETKKGFLQKMFPKEGESVPEVRFPGFFGEWEQRKLSDIKDVRDGTHDSPKYYNEGFPLVTSKNLTENGLDMTDVSLISEEDFQSINKRSKVDIGDIIFGMIGTIGNPIIVDREGFAIKNVALIKNGGEVTNVFLIQLLKSQIFGKYIQNENAGNTQKFLGLSKIRNYQFLSPSYQEQIKIGNFFKQLDDTIALHQRELDALKETKKAFLQKMFV
ncbi:restriction endonuclease subunit S [Bacillus cereus]|uniref:restriction endonuclease subunit S n=1 Tax=Bacillus cereus TaxID=1396 RepID=UPI00345B8F6D